MKIQIDTDGDKTQITLLEVAWGVQDLDDGAKLIVFGDEKCDLIIPMAHKPASRMGARLMLETASNLVGPDGTVTDLRKARQNGS